MLFTPQEIDQFLGKQDLTNRVNFKVQRKGDVSPIMLSLEAFESFFKIKYRPFLTFQSDKVFDEVIHECPYILRCQWLVRENYDWAMKFRSQVSSGFTVPISIQWINPVMGYGAFADEDISEGGYVSEYTGVVRRVFRRHPDHNAYCLQYPTRWWAMNYYVVDAWKESNLMRFVNHSEHPNLQPLCLVDRGLLHQVFVANQDILKGTQLTFNYGPDFWARRKRVSKF